MKQLFTKVWAGLRGTKRVVKQMYWFGAWRSKQREWLLAPWEKTVAEKRATPQEPRPLAGAIQYCWAEAWGPGNKYPDFILFPSSNLLVPPTGWLHLEAREPWRPADAHLTGELSGLGESRGSWGEAWRVVAHSFTCLSCSISLGVPLHSISTCPNAASLLSLAQIMSVSPNCHWLFLLSWKHQRCLVPTDYIAFCAFKWCLRTGI